MKIYIQIGEGTRRYKVNASLTKPTQPLKTGGSYDNKFLPTITFAIDAKFDKNIFNESVKSITEFQLTNEMIQSPSPQVNVIEVEE